MEKNTVWMWETERWKGGDKVTERQKMGQAEDKIRRVKESTLLRSSTER